MEFKNLLFEKKENGIGLLTLNRPQALNALNKELIEELELFTQQLHEMPWSEVKALVITGAGEKSFVAGADIKEMSVYTQEQAQFFSKKGQKVFRNLESLKIPVVAAVNGFALGGGLELALSCDFIYASSNAKLGLPEVSLGLIPGFGGTVRLSRVVGLNKAREMVYSAEMITADEAFQCGLVNKVVAQVELMPTVMKTVETMISRGPIAVAKAKLMVLESYDMSIDAGLELEAINFGQLFKYQDTKEGTTAFSEKRKPQFKNV